MRIGLNNPQDFLALLVRRKWWVLVLFVTLSCAASILIYFLPHTYVSETLILVTPRDVPQDFVRDLIAGSPEERLRSIEQRILSRQTLLQIIREFENKLPEIQRLNIDDQIAKLRGQITIKFELEKGRNGQDLPLSYFRIFYQNQNPELAQKIASKLTTLFIEEDNKTRATQVFGTTEFFATELEKVKTDLTDSEEKLRDIKSTRLYELPDQRDANLRTLERLSMDKKSNSEALDRIATQRLTVESQMLTTPPTLPKNPLYAVVPQRGMSEKQKKIQQDLDDYRKAQAEYEDATSKYTDSHPDVKLTRARLEKVKQRLSPEVLALAMKDDEEDASSPTQNEAGEPNPAYQQLVAQLEGIKTELRVRQREKSWVEGEIAKYSARVDRTPQAEQDISDVARHNADLKKKYDDYNNKLSEARLAESLESKQKGSQFQIVDPANYPIAPTKPNKSAVAVGSILVSLLIALATAVGVDIARQKVWTQTQAEAFWGTPVLVEIPEIVTDLDLAVARKKRIGFATSSVVFALLYSVCLYGIYLKHSFILRQLDPVIQKLIYK
jgi:succinoglycan biosynthesis transport protein ExoP